MKSHLHSAIWNIKKMFTAIRKENILNYFECWRSTTNTLPFVNVQFVFFSFSMCSDLFAFCSFSSISPLPLRPFLILSLAFDSMRLVFSFFPSTSLHVFFLFIESFQLNQSTIELSIDNGRLGESTRIILLFSCIFSSSEFRRIATQDIDSK